VTGRWVAYWQARRQPNHTGSNCFALMSTGIVVGWLGDPWAEKVSDYLWTAAFFGYMVIGLAWLINKGLDWAERELFNPALDRWYREAGVRRVERETERAFGRRRPG
jgi:hypothetical protein